MFKRKAIHFSITLSTVYSYTAKILCEFDFYGLMKPMNIIVPWQQLAVIVALVHDNNN